MLHYLDGKWVKEKDLKISVFDISVLRGFGVFDFLRTYKQEPFRLEAHVDRLFNSAKLLGIRLPKTKSEIEKIVVGGLAKNKKEAEEFNIRIVATGGVSEDSISVGEPAFIIIYSKAQDYPEEYYTKGVKVTTFAVERYMSAVKSLNYMMGVAELARAREQGAVEIVHVDNDDGIYEGMTSNFFAVVDGRLVTPKERILSGITREVVFELADELGIEYEEREMNLKESDSFDEAFITASNKEIMPVVEIDDEVVGNGTVGPITAKLIASFRKLTRGMSNS